MLAEGVDPQTIERAATQMGFPAPPLAMIDEVSLVLPQKIRDEATAAAEAARGRRSAEHPGMAVIDRMVDEFERLGKAAGAGFYDYPDDGPKQPLAGSARALRQRRDAVSATSSPTSRSGSPSRCRSRPSRASPRASSLDRRRQHRLDLRHRLPAAVRRRAAVHADNYQGSGGTRSGVARGFVARARELAAAYGERFEPPACLST